MTNRVELEAAFDSRDLARLIALMDEGVVWRGVPTLREPHDDDEPYDDGEAEHEHLHVPICRTRDEVRDVMQGFIDQGGDARPVILATRGDSIVVEVRPRTGEGNSDDGALPLFQVLTFRGGRIALIQDYPEWSTALQAVGA